MQSMAEIYLEKTAEDKKDKVTKEDLFYALKKHEDRERPSDEAKESKREQDIEKKLDIEKHAAQTTAADIKNNPRATLVVTFMGEDHNSKIFIQRLDRVMQQMSGIDRLDIKAFNTLKEPHILKQLEVPKIGATIYRRGKPLDVLAHDSVEGDIRKFFENNRKNMV